MPRSPVCTVTFIAVIALAAPFSHGAEDAPPAAQTESGRAALFFERTFQEDLESSPEFQTSLGQKTNYDRWDDRSEAATTEDLARTVRHLAELRRTINFAALDASSQVSYRLFEYQAERAIRGYPWRFHAYAIDQTGGPFASLPGFLINEHRVDTIDDARAYVARLRGLATVLEQLGERLDRQVAAGIVPPRWVFPRATEIARNVIAGAPFAVSATESPLWADVRAKVAALDGVDDTTRAAVLAEAQAALTDIVRPAWEGLLARWLAAERRATDDDGVWKLPDGAAYYNHRLAGMTTTALTAAEIHAIGLREVARIQDEMRALMPRLEFSGELSALFTAVRADQRLLLPDTPEGRQEYLARATAVIDTMRPRLDELFLRKPRADIVVKATEAFREKSAPKAFYQGPAPNGTRPGMYYVTLYDMREMPTFTLDAIAYHEGIPGHHMQVAIAQELTALPRFRRFGGTVAYGEGWALYAELLPKEIGLYTDPWSDFGRLTTELWRAVRLVVDTGIHAQRWTRQQAIDYFFANTAQSRDEIVREIERYIMTPGQATSYKIGMLKILELRERARHALGARFDLREFHDVILRDGSLPLGLVEENVDAWIATKAMDGSRE